jgi:hypothetical protein
MVKPDGGGNPSEDDRKRARGYNAEQMKALYEKYQAAVAAYDANPNAQTANAMASALALLQDAATNGHDPSGKALASSMSLAAQQQFENAQKNPGLASGTGPAVAASPTGPSGFQGGVSPAAPGGTQLGAGPDAGNNVGGSGIANRIAQSLIAQNPGAQARGQAIGGAAQNPAMPPQTGYGQAGPPIGGFASGGPAPQAPAPQVPNVQLPANYGAGYQNIQQGQLPGGGFPTVQPMPSGATPPPNGQAFGGPGQPDSLGSPHTLYGSGASSPPSGMPTTAPASMNTLGDSPIGAMGGQQTNDVAMSNVFPDTNAQVGVQDVRNDPSSWWAQQGINTGNMYTDFNVFDTKGGGFNNVLNAYEQSAGLPGYWSDQMGPLIDQAILTSYLGDNPLDTQQEVLNAIPGFAQQLSTPGSYYDPHGDWTGFLQNPMPGPGASSGVDAFSAQSPQDQVGWAQQMWQTISGQSVDPTYVSTGMYQIQALGDQYALDRASGQFTGNFLDYLRAHGADSWL